MDDETRRARRNGLEAAAIAPDEETSSDGEASPSGAEAPIDAADVLGLLRAAWRPQDLAVEEHEAILGRALGTANVGLERGEEPELEPTEEELREAECLRDALSAQGHGATAHPLADLAKALAAAHSPRALDGATHETLLERALPRSRPVTSLDERRSGSSRARRPARAATRTTTLARVTGAVGGALALAAAFALLLESKRAGAPAPEAPPSPAHVAETRPVELIQARSTMELFDAPFEQKGGESKRLDRITASRSADYRANRFASWGVR